jgi:hypothetical protein
VRKSERKFFVFISLVSVLTLTSALLLALAPAPLTPDTSGSLFAVDAPSLARVFNTPVSTRSNWKYIYVHHSKTAVGSASLLGERTGGLADHFLIGNGQGAFDGEIQISRRWDEQTHALPPAGASKLDPSSISICVVGDFDKSLPTPVQMRALNQLVAALQSRMNIPARNVVIVTDAVGTSAGSGKYFPVTAFRDSLMP